MSDMNAPAASGMGAPLTRLSVFRSAVPVILAQAATATTGVVDTLVIGRFGDKVELGGVAVAAILFGFIYWGFGFLRMSTTGLASQADGRGDAAGLDGVFQRAVGLAAAFGLGLVALSPVLISLGLPLFRAEPDVQAEAAGYLQARFWGAPAALMGFAVTGYLLGVGRTGALLAVQIVMNAVNCGLDVWFVAGLDWGPAGIGAGTAIAEWVALAFALFLVRPRVRMVDDLLNADKLKALFSTNRDILIRTIAMVVSLAWFVRSGAGISTAALAGNEVLLQFVTVSAFILDGFAFVAERETGLAFGAGDRARLVRAFRLTSEFALVSGVLLFVMFLFGGGAVISAFIADPEARAVALTYLPYCALTPIVGAMAWQLDGLFIGTLRGAALRNAAIMAMAAYVATDLVLSSRFGNAGVWSALVCFYAYRALALAVFVPGLLRAFSPAQSSETSSGPE